MTVHELKVILMDMPMGVEIVVKHRRHTEGRFTLDHVEVVDGVCYIVAGEPKE